MYYTTIKAFLLRDKIRGLSKFLNSKTYKRFEENPKSSISTWIMLSKFFSDKILNTDDIFDFSMSIDSAYKRLKDSKFELSELDDYFKTYYSEEDNYFFHNMYIDFYQDVQLDNKLISTFEDYRKYLLSDELEELMHVIWAPVSYFEVGLENLNNFNKVLIFSEVGLPKPKNNDNNIDEMKNIINKAKNLVEDHSKNLNKMLKLFYALQSHFE
jgi:hypothetical protein